MEVTFYGMNCVRLTARNIAVVCDPPPASAGTLDIKQTNDVTLLTVPKEGGGGYGPVNLPAKPGMVIDRPGEYEVHNAMITGVGAKLHTDLLEDSTPATIYSITLDGVRVAFLGNVQPDISNEQIEQLGQTDVLIIPVGNHGLTLSPEAAAKIISQLEPKYVVPTHYDDGTTKFAIPQAIVGDFLKEMGATSEPIAKLKVNLKEMPLETQVVVLQRQAAS